MKNEDILSLVDELPLFVTLKLKRSIQDLGGEPTTPLGGLFSRESAAGSAAENLNDESSSTSSGRTSPNINNVKV